MVTKESTWYEYFAHKLHERIVIYSKVYPNTNLQTSIRLDT